MSVALPSLPQPQSNSPQRAGLVCGRQVPTHGFWPQDAMAGGSPRGRLCVRETGSPCRWLTKGQVAETPPCSGCPRATGHFWCVCHWGWDMCFGALSSCVRTSLP